MIQVVDQMDQLHVKNKAAEKRVSVLEAELQQLQGDADKLTAYNMYLLQQVASFVLLKIVQ
jgi:hypothetical protein